MSQTKTYKLAPPVGAPGAISISLQVGRTVTLEETTDGLMLINEWGTPVALLQSVEEQPQDDSIEAVSERVSRFSDPPSMQPILDRAQQQMAEAEAERKGQS